MYLPPATTQPDSVSCVPTATKDGINQATAGARDPSVYSIRAAEGDYSGGMSYIQMTDATQKVAGIQSWAKFGVSPSEVLATVEAGHPCVVSIDTNVTAPYPKVRTYYFRGGHSEFVPAGGFSLFIPTGERCTCEKETTARHGEYTYEDPGTSAGYNRISAELLNKAMLARADNGGCNILVLPDVVNIKRRVLSTAKGYVRSQPSTTSAARRRLVPGETLRLNRPMAGSRWRRPNGTYATGWWQLEDNAGFVRADKVSVTNA